jgi:hypothetical protein
VVSWSPVKLFKRLLRFISLTRRIGEMETSIAQIRDELVIRSVSEIDFQAFESRVELLSKLLRPPIESQNVPLVRVGGPGDGEYVLADIWEEKAEKQSVVSIGVGNEVSADLELARRGHPVYLFDHTIPKPPLWHEKFNFHRLGLGAADENDLVSMESLLGLLPDTVDSATLLCDIEGAEWESLFPATKSLTFFTQAAFELHGLLRFCLTGENSKVLAVIQDMRANFTPIHWSANNISPRYLFAGYFVPNLVEVSFIRNDQLLSLPYSESQNRRVSRSSNKEGLWNQTFEPFSRIGISSLWDNEADAYSHRLRPSSTA